MRRVADPQDAAVGLMHPGGVAGITSEWWPASVRNGGRLQIGIPAGINSEYLAGMRRNLHGLREGSRLTLRTSHTTINGGRVGRRSFIPRYELLREGGDRRRPHRPRCSTP